MDKKERKRKVHEIFKNTGIKFIRCYGYADNERFTDSTKCKKPISGMSWKNTANQIDTQEADNWMEIGSNIAIPMGQYVEGKGYLYNLDVDDWDTHSHFNVNEWAGFKTWNSKGANVYFFSEKKIEGKACHPQKNEDGKIIGDVTLDYDLKGDGGYIMAPDSILDLHGEPNIKNVLEDDIPLIDIQEIFKKTDSQKGTQKDIVSKTSKMMVTPTKPTIKNALENVEITQPVTESMNRKVYNISNISNNDNIHSQVSSNLYAVKKHTIPIWNKISNIEEYKKYLLARAEINKKLTDDDIYHYTNFLEKNYYIKKGISIIKINYKIPPFYRTKTDYSDTTEVYDFVADVIRSPKNESNGLKLVSLTPSPLSSMVEYFPEKPEYILIYRPTERHYISLPLTKAEYKILQGKNNNDIIKSKYCLRQLRAKALKKAKYHNAFNYKKIIRKILSGKQKTFDRKMRNLAMKMEKKNGVPREQTKKWYDMLQQRSTDTFASQYNPL